jgi:hypothetical protein
MASNGEYKMNTSWFQKLLFPWVILICNGEIAVIKILHGIEYIHMIKFAFVANNVDELI